MRTPIEPIDCLELVILCHQELAPDAPQPSTHYINKILKTMTINQALLNKLPLEIQKRLAETIKKANAPTNTDYAVDTLQAEVNQLKKELKKCKEENLTMKKMLTDPDVLADYVNRFFGPDGPYPTETSAETAARKQVEALAK